MLARACKFESCSGHHCKWNVGASQRSIFFCNHLTSRLILYERRNYCVQSFLSTFDSSCTINYNMEAKTGILNNEKEATRLERISNILKTVAHPMRLGIVNLLEQYPRLSVTEICEMLGSEQSLTSHHLQNMRLKGILSVKRDGRSMLYSLKERDVSLIIECLENCQCNM